MAPFEGLWIPFGQHTGPHLDRPCTAFFEGSKTAPEPEQPRRGTSPRATRSPLGLGRASPFHWVGTGLRQGVGPALDGARTAALEGLKTTAEPLHGKGDPGEGGGDGEVPQGAIPRWSTHDELNQLVDHFTFIIA